MTRAELQPVTVEYRWADRGLAGPVFTLVLCLGAALTGGILGGAAAISAVAIIGYLMLRRIGLFEVSMALIPLMFYITFGVRYNISAADFIVAFLAYQAVAQRSPETNLASRKLLNYLVFLLVAVGLSILSANVSATILTSNSRAVTEVSKLLVCGLYVLVYLVLSMNRLAIRDMRFIQIWVWSSVSVAVLACLSLVIAIPGYAPFSAWRATGSFEDPNLLGAYLLCSLGLTIGYNRLRSGRPLGFNVIALVLGVVATGSRAAMIVLAAGVLGLVLYSVLVSRRIDIPSTLCIIGAAVTSIFWFPVISNAGGRGEFALREDARFDLWSIGVRAFQDSPFFGIGYGQFPLVAARYVEGGTHFVMHNTFLSFLVETGVIGGLLTSGAYVMLLGWAMRTGGNSVLAGACAFGLLMLGCALFAINGQNVRFVWVFIAISLAAVWSHGGAGQVVGDTENRAD
ncbi:MAG: O-antigen ligase family protein [Dietzia maris]